jgi:hypothetical protein
MSKQLSLRTISERLADSIISEKIISKESLIDKIMLNLRVWHKLTNRPVDYNSIKTEKGVLQLTIEKKDIELQYWRDKLKEHLGKDKMNNFYNELDFILEEMGYPNLKK